MKKQITLSRLRTGFCLFLPLVSAGTGFRGVCQDQDKYKLNPTRDAASQYKVYVPTNLEDAFGELNKMLHPDLVKEMKEAPEREMSGYHMGLGLWMRNNWGLWGGSCSGKTIIRGKY